MISDHKSARKFAGKAATVGSAALIGGIAFKAYKNWQQNNQGENRAVNQQQSAPQTHYSGEQAAPNHMPEEFQLALIKAMIGAAKADGYIDEIEQKRIFDAVEQISINSEVKR